MFADPTVFRSLAALHRAGVSWPQAVASAAGGDAAFGPVRQRLLTGASLADALAPVVDALDRALLRAGEQTGTLEMTLERIAVRHEGEARLKTTRTMALLYPVVMGHVAAGLAGLPDVIGGRPLTGLLWTLAVLAPVYAVLWVLRRRGPQAAGHPGTRPPRATGLRRSAVEEADVRGLLALADGYESGLRIDETLGLAADAGAGGRVAFDLHRARPRVAGGAALHTAWLAVPDDLAQSLRVGEETGELGRAARQSAAELGFRVEMRRKKIASLLPLGLLLLVGAIVAWRVISFYSGIYGDLGRMPR